MVGGKGGHHHDVTFHGLHDWHKHKFEKLGWMILAKSYGDDYKIDNYPKGIEHLRDSLKYRLDNTESEDRKADILVMHRNSITLLDAAKKLLKSIKGDEDKEAPVSNRIEKYDVTYHGLHKWHKHMFEKLGWMVLAKKHGYDDKIGCYVNGIRRLREALEQKVLDGEDQTKDADHRKDLAILHKDVLILQVVAPKLMDMVKMEKESEIIEPKKSMSNVKSEMGSSEEMTGGAYLKYRRTQKRSSRRTRRTQKSRSN